MSREKCLLKYFVKHKKNAKIGMIYTISKPYNIQQKATPCCIRLISILVSIRDYLVVKTNIEKTTTQQSYILHGLIVLYDNALPLYNQ